MISDDSVNVQVHRLGRALEPDASTPTLVVLHGYGSSERDLVAGMPAAREFLSNVDATVIFVRGFFEIPGRPGRYSWFPGDASAQPSAEAIAETAETLIDAVAAHTQSAVWLGFSQGMCAAITAMRRRPEIVRALVGLSGFSFDAPQPGDLQLARDVAAGRGIPAFYGRDLVDPSIPDFASAWVLRFLRTHTAIEEHSYPNMGHNLSMPEIIDVLKFLGPFLDPEVQERVKIG